MTKEARQKEYQDFDYLDNDSWYERLPEFELTASSQQADKPKVSVIIANYNNAPYLKKMMDSLVNQTIGLEHMQVLFVDDRSTDNSLEIVTPYTQTYPSIEVYALKQNTGGAHGPRNVGLRHVRGEYLVVLDADDWYALDALSYMSQLLDESGDDMAVTGIVQSADKRLSPKSRVYTIDGDFKNRPIDDLPTEFYGWLGPQAIILRTSLVLRHNLHFVNQRVADDVTFFYQALRCAGTITQGQRLTTYLNRDADNNSLSKAINRQFMISWLRALSFIDHQYPDDISKRRFMIRRLEWLVHDFALKRKIGYRFGMKRLVDFKAQLTYYLGDLPDDYADGFRTDARRIAWHYLQTNQIKALYWFVQVHSARVLLYRHLGWKEKRSDGFYFPQLLKKIPSVRIMTFIVAEQLDPVQLTLEVTAFSHNRIQGFEAKKRRDPFDRQVLSFQELGNNRYLIMLPNDFQDDLYIITSLVEGYREYGIAGLKSLAKKQGLVKGNYEA